MSQVAIIVRKKIWVCSIPQLANAETQTPRLVAGNDTLGAILAIALLAPLLVLNALALSVIFEYFHSLIVILVAASLLAFLLNYPVSWMERQGAIESKSLFWYFGSSFIGIGCNTSFPLSFPRHSS